MSERERLANLMHEIWAHWMKYVFARCWETLDADMVIPFDFASRWQRQMDMDYEQLSEQDKESDRQQADKILAVLEEYNEDQADRNGPA